MTRPHTILFLSILASTAACKNAVDDAPAAKTTAVKSNAEPATKASGGLALDASASEVAFVGAKVTGDHRGKFMEISGQAVLDGDTPKSLSMTVQVASLEIDPAKLGKHLRSNEFFDVEQFPTATFASTSIMPSPSGEATHEITGNLTMKGIEKEIVFPATLTVDAASARGTAKFSINRREWNVIYDGAPDDLVRDDVLLELTLVYPRG